MDREKEVSVESKRPSEQTEDTTAAAMYCPNCGARLEGQKCKLLCLTPGCGYRVTCSEW